MSDHFVTTRYWLGGFGVQATVPPDLAQVRALSRFVHAQVAADFAFTLERTTCDHQEPNSAIPIERILPSGDARAYARYLRVRATTKKWVGYIDLAGQRIWLLSTPDSVDEAYVELLRRYLYYVVSPSKGIFIHCAGVHLAGQTLLFLAPSGTGKTTLSRRAYEKGFHVLSDETVFVSWDTPEFVAHATPFGRLSSGPLSTPISKVFFLRQADAFAVRPMSAPRAVIAAWKDSYYRDFWEEIPGEFILHFRNDAIGPEQKRLIISRWYELFSSVPCYEMQFPRDFDDWDSLLALP